jgi:hypothetical protein
MPSPKGVITIEGSYEQAYYCEQDYVAQATTHVTPCGPDGPGRDARRMLAEGATKAAAVLHQPSIVKAVKTSSGSGGSAGPSIQALDPQKGLTQSR